MFTPKIHPPASTLTVGWTCNHFQISFILHILQWNKYIERGWMMNGGSGHRVRRI